jgi:hypothetical protein
VQLCFDTDRNVADVGKDVLGFWLVFKHAVNV